MPIGTLFVVPEWHKSKEGEEIVSILRSQQSNYLQQFYLLQTPKFTRQNYEVFEYKIFLCGKSGVGKTSLATKLCGEVHENLLECASETLGLQKFTVYWPAKIADVGRVVLFKLQLWDAGENAVLRYDYLLKAAKDKMDAAMFVFSFSDAASFTDLAHRMMRTLLNDDNCCKFACGTKLDQHSDVQVSLRDVGEFESSQNVKVLSVCRSSPGDSVASALNYVCDQLWLRDQVNAGRMPPQ